MSDITVIIAEKPSVAKAFADALNCSRRQDGFYASDAYVVVYCLGHLVTLAEPSHYNIDYKAWSVEHLPIVPDRYAYVPLEGTETHLRKLKKALTEYATARIVVATDAGREGELIARTTLQYLGIRYNSARRFWSSAALTSKAILSGLRAAKPIAEYDMLYKRGYSRQAGDWLVGMNFTRFFTLSLQNDKRVFSFGRVQTPLLNAIVKRQKEITGFIATDRYKLGVSINIGNSVLKIWLLNTADDTVYHQNPKELTEKVRSITENTTITLETVEVKKLTTMPPLLFSLTELQKVANTAHGFTAEKTLEIVQELYEKEKLVSYPRTASSHMSQEDYLVFCNVVKRLKNAYPVLFANTGEPDIQNKRIFDREKVEDHHALIVLDIPLSALPEDASKIYTMIAERMATVLRGAQIVERVDLQLKDSAGAMYRGLAFNVIDPGWAGLKASLSENSNSDEEEQYSLCKPYPIQGQHFRMGKAEVATSKTKAPPNYTEATLLSLMEKYCLGTAATRASIISTLINRGLCERSGKNIKPSDMGRFFIQELERLKHTQLAQYLDLEYTKVWETKLETDPIAFYQALRESVCNSIEEIKKENIKKFAPVCPVQCPECGSALIEEAKRFRCSRPDGACAFTLGKSIGGANFSSEELFKIIQGKPSRLKTFVSARTGQKYKAKVLYDKGKHALAFVFPDR